MWFCDVLVRSNLVFSLPKIKQRGSLSFWTSTVKVLEMEMNIPIGIN